MSNSKEAFDYYICREMPKKAKLFDVWQASRAKAIDECVKKCLEDKGDWRDCASAIQQLKEQP